ncbi:restriction endonuclease [Chlorobium phaeovibrioides]|uniref:Restriction endonuclease n=1 Tax=Chlorobium phaeovibrioides TaxID=1094 RepID=A0A5M8IFB7_CHLPH|nr:restriction endonuclease [Chlorobium phaeovibrioides]KAA6233112.1 restriction endonuclease [Chlorobium phaeovibrioides]
MNHWTQLSIDFANQRNYLDELFSVYPTIPEGIRDIDQALWDKAEGLFNEQNNIELLKVLLKLNLFPIKDSYVAYLKRDNNSIERNPNTVDRLCGRLYEMGLEKIYEKCSEPKETNRQIGPLFRRWLNRGVLGVKPVSLEEFLSNDKNAILDAGDAQMMAFANEHLNYTHEKGLDFVGRFNGKYVIGEAKFLTDFGGHQNAQFNDAISTVKTNVDAETIAILDGVLYINGRNKMYRSITEELTEYNIMSSLVLRDFLYQI